MCVTSKTMTTEMMMTTTPWSSGSMLARRLIGRRIDPSSCCVQSLPLSKVPAHARRGLALDELVSLSASWVTELGLPSSLSPKICIQAKFPSLWASS